MAFKKKRDIEEVDKYQRLIEKIVIKKDDIEYEEIDNLCFLSKNLYNATLYSVRQHFFNEKEFLSYYKINKVFTDANQPDYRALPAKVSKQTQMLVNNNFNSFFKLLEKKNAGTYDGKIKIPKYLDKVKGRQVVIYPKDALSFKDKGYIKLSKTNIKIKTNKTKDEILEVRLVSRNNYCVIEIVYEILKNKPVDKKNRYAAIDIGVDNLMTVSSNVTNPIIINGKPLKSINEFYNKELARVKSEIMKCQGKYTSSKIQNLYKRRKYKIEDYMHKSSRMLVNHLVSNNIDTLIIGENKGWKQDINIGTKNNRIFVSIPFDILKQFLKYKCETEGIEVVFTEESYTSKASFLDKDKIPKYSKKFKGKRVFSGRRTKRGLYKTKDGVIVNADLNGASNIMKKYLLKNKLWSNQLFKEVSARITKNPVILNVA